MFLVWLLCGRLNAADSACIHTCEIFSLASSSNYYYYCCYYYYYSCCCCCYCYYYYYYYAMEQFLIRQRMPALPLKYFSNFLQLSWNHPEIDIQGCCLFFSCSLAILLFNFSTAVQVFKQLDCHFLFKLSFQVYI